MEQENKGKVQKINDEDYEIVKKLETDGFLKTAEWYKEYYECDLSEAKEALLTIKGKYNVKYEGSEHDEIRMILESANDIDKTIELYKEKYGVSEKEAWNKVYEAIKFFNSEDAKNKGTSSSNGCMITILIAITTTFSVFWLL